MKEVKIPQLEKAINGVPVEKLQEVINAIKCDPSIAEFRFRATNRWVGGSLNRTEVRGFYGAGREDTLRTEPFVLMNDEAPVLLGTDKGPNPVESLLSALAGCMTTTMVYHAAAAGIIIEEVESELQGELDLRGFLKLDPSVRKGFSNITVKFRVKSNASPELLKELAEGSPVYDMVCNPVPIKLTIETKRTDRSED